MAAMNDIGYWDSISAISTFMAVVLSLFTLWVQRRREYQLRLDEDDRQRRVQAGYISVWFDDTREIIWIENRSEQPIYDAGTSLLMANPPADGRRHLPIDLAGGLIRVVPPRHRVEVFPQAEVMNPVPILAFRDAQGVSWHRDEHGNLTELKEGVFQHFALTPQMGYSTGSPDPL